jgi:hypothetical protein
MTKSHISQEQLKELFDYCAETGNLIWKKSQQGGKVVVGGPLGSEEILNNGYQRRITHLKGRMYRVHRLVWLWHYGTLPKMIDHKDNNALNNRIENLRECTVSQNNSNRRFTGNKSGYKGVCKVEKNNSISYTASIKINNRNKHLGTFKTAEEAHEAYKKAAIQRHSEFYRFE